jgi:hypothetical protein
MELETLAYKHAQSFHLTLCCTPSTIHLDEEWRLENAADFSGRCAADGFAAFPGDGLGSGWRR